MGERFPWTASTRSTNVQNSSIPPRSRRPLDSSASLAVRRRFFRMSMIWKVLCVLLMCWCTPALVARTVAEEGDGNSDEAEFASPVDDEGRLVQFERDIAPILRSRCLECHGPEDAKNDFRVDDRDTLLGYVEPEDAQWSTLYAD